jgi:hypothetical protein
MSAPTPRRDRATGAIGGASYVLALRALVDLWTLGIALATLTVLNAVEDL